MLMLPRMLMERAWPLSLEILVALF
ncbi:hypothetical protein Gorai_013073 [Gossypium raimondii]|uniref:Uncharacterized protein n=1 Tax=Gossypium raimondii TaxID=29730 RepID=A0A7J8Q3W5_GOSRA|nr:hypothetical protein [Gossypium raimondii]